MFLPHYCESTVCLVLILDMLNNNELFVVTSFAIVLPYQQAALLVYESFVWDSFCLYANVRSFCV